ncbi:hypothetical protein HK101_006364, partial [Irineochytrium annulatum]
STNSMSLTPPASVSADPSPPRHDASPSSFVDASGKLHPSYFIPSFEDMFSLPKTNGDLDDVFADLTLDEAVMTSSSSTKFLNDYSKDDIFDEFSSVNMAEALAKNGY